MTLPDKNTDYVVAIPIEGTALAAHFNFQQQSGVTMSDLRLRYKSLAAKNTCLLSPFAFD